MGEGVRGRKNGEMIERYRVRHNVSRSGRDNQI